MLQEKATETLVITYHTVVTGESNRDIGNNLSHGVTGESNVRHSNNLSHGVTGESNRDIGNNCVTRCYRRNNVRQVINNLSHGVTGESNVRHINNLSHVVTGESNVRQVITYHTVLQEKAT